MERAEWLAWRRQGLGSSDSPIIAGASKFKTPLELYFDKIGDGPIEEERNYILDLGNEVEEIVRSRFEDAEGCDFKPALLEMKDDASFLRASLDGLSPAGDIALEIKLLGGEDFDMTMNGIVPPQYVHQVQKVLLVSGAQACVFLAAPYKKTKREVLETHFDNYAIIEVEPDQKMIEELIARESAFWHDNVLARVEPPASDRDFKSLSGFSPHVKKWLALNTKIKALSAEMEAIRAEIEAGAEADGHNRYEASGVRITRQLRAGAIDYSLIEELKAIDLEKYRKKGSSYWKLDAPKTEKEKTNVKKQKAKN